jgi:hypothetical protein
MDRYRSPEELEPECQRTGVNLGEALRLIMSRFDPYGPPVKPGVPINIGLNVDQLERILKSLPHGAGTEKFVEAFMVDAMRMKLRRPPDSAGA